MDGELNKRRNGAIIAIFPIFTLIIVVILLAIVLIYVQVTSTILSIKTDLLYILKNSIIAYNSYELSYEEYQVDEVALRNTIYTILRNNYVSEGSLVKSIEIKELYVYNGQEADEHTDGRYKVPIVHIKVEVKFSPIIKLANDKENYNILMHEDIKLTLLEYGGN